MQRGGSEWRGGKREDGQAASKVRQTTGSLRVTLRVLAVKWGEKRGEGATARATYRVEAFARVVSRFPPFNLSLGVCRNKHAAFVDLEFSKINLQKHVVTAGCSELHKYRLATVQAHDLRGKRKQSSVNAA